MAADSSLTAFHDRFQHLLDALSAVASLDFSHRLEIIGDESMFDAAAATVNMLAEEMEASHRELSSRSDELGEQKALLEAVVSSMGEGIVVANENGEHILRNPAARRILGEGGALAVRSRIYRSDRRTPFPVDDLPIVRALHGESTDDVAMFICSEAAPEGVEISVAGRPVVHADGRRRGALVVFRDVTERNRADAAMRRLAAIVDASTDAIISYKLDGTITTWNRGAEELFGASADEAVGTLFERFIPPEGRVEWRTIILGAVTCGDSVRDHENPRLRLDGSRIIVATSAAPIADATGAVIGVSAINRDITAAKAMERELKNAKEHAEDAARAKSEFLANMSHEIRTPLTAVLGFADLLLDRSLSENVRLDHLMTIRRNGEHLLSVINDILDLSKIDARAIVVEKIECSPSEILNDVASSMRVRATEKGISFDVRFASPIPTRIESDPTRLRQILLNLVGNAVKFTESGHVLVTARLDSSTLIIDVADTGIGLAPDQVEDIFRPFRQADPSLTRRFGGTGLGLAICVPLAIALGGTIHVTSELSKGSTFSLRLPVAIRPDTAMAISPTDARGAMRASVTSAPIDETPIDARVLLAEDGIDNQVLLSSILVKRGVDVCLAENGNLAVELALAAKDADRPFHLILMDMQMPELDGYGATARLRSANYEGPIVALTAHAFAGERARCIAAGCDDYLTKPIDRALLLKTVRNYANRRVVPVPIHSTLAGEPEMDLVIGGFVERTKATVERLRECEATGDIASLRRLAHQLRGAGGGYGFAEVTEAAAQLEAALGENNLVFAHAPLAHLMDICSRLRAGVS